MSFAYLPLYVGDYLRDTPDLTLTEHGIYLRLLMFCWSSRGPVPPDEARASRIVNASSDDERVAVKTILCRYFVLHDDGWYNPRMEREIARCNAISGVRSEAGRAGVERMRRMRQANAQANAPANASANAIANGQANSQANEEHVTLSPSPYTNTNTNTNINTKTNPKNKNKNTLHHRDAESTQTSHPRASRSARVPKQPQPPPREPDGFAEFWSAYPRKVGKKSALAAWEKLAPDEPLRKTIGDALAWQRESAGWLRDDGQYIPHPERWLRNRRWEDEAPKGAERDWI